MAIKRLGAQRFSGLAADVASLPLDADLIGAIFNSTDTLEFWINDGSGWKPGAGGGGGITGLEPSSTILEYSTDILDYTTPSAATATSGTPANAIDDNTTTFWVSDAGMNESITLNMGAAVNMYGLAYFISTAELATMTETQFQIQAVTSADAGWTNVVNTIGSGALNFSYVGNSLNNASSFDLTSFIPNDSNFLLRGKLTFTTMTNPTGTLFSWFGLSDSDASVSGNAAQEFIGMSIIKENAITDIVRAQDTDGTAPSVGATDGTTTYSLGVETVFFEIIRSSTTAYSIELFSDAGFTTTLGVIVNGACPATINGLQYIKTMNNAGNTLGGSITGTMDDLEFWLGVTVPTGAPDVSITFTSQLLSVLRTINKSDLLPDVFNFIRFNGANNQFLRIEGSSGSSLVMVANELAVQLEADPPLTTLHGQFDISGTNAGLALNGGDPTTSVIDDPVTNSMTLTSTVTQNDPPTDGMVMWNEVLDVNNSVSHSKMKIDGAIKDVRWF